MNCKWCGVEFEKLKRGTRLLIPRMQRPKGGCCNENHYERLRDSKNIKEFKCSNCGDVFYAKRCVTGMCASCIPIVNPTTKIGPENPNWKGGHRNWSPGRYGKDKDGLSWKKQRILAVERDNNKCQDSECKGKHPRICVHHISPYRISMSHALDNLICYCDGCHGKHESECHENWGGQLVKNKPNKVKLKCSICRFNKLKLNNGTCSYCVRYFRNEKIYAARLSGKSYPVIAKEFGFKSHAGVIVIVRKFNQGVG